MAELTTCVIVGGGPAGMVAGLLLARAGVAVTLLEKHADFLRDFRGDTVHPSTLRLLDELGLWENFTALPHSRIEHVGFPADDGELTLVDFRRLRTPHRYIAMVPQWDLLDLLAAAAEAEPTFTLRMSHEVTGLLRDGSRITGVRYTGPDGDGELHAAVTIACDGRWSTARRASGLPVTEWPVPFDVWWFRLPRGYDAEYTLIPRSAPGRLVVMIPRQGYFQVGFLIPKGSDATLRARGLDVFKAEVAELIPEGDTSALRSWDDVKVLDVRLSRLRRWHAPGLVCIGDAAHAMSPMGGVGINLAVQDAVATATLLAEPLRRGAVTEADLAAVRRRRLLPTALTQAVQRVLHRVVVLPAMRGALVRPPKAFAVLLRRIPALSWIPARVIGIGVRPERAPAFARR